VDIIINDAAGNPTADLTKVSDVEADPQAG
jgi:hypothetical protein